jgi:hypothetical protein
MKAGRLRRLAEKKPAKPYRLILLAVPRQLAGMDSDTAGHHLHHHHCSLKYAVK